MKPAQTRAFMHDFPWIHLGVGIFGNVMFVVGSVFFLFEDLQIPGTWLFVLGSSGMLIGSLGELAVRVERHSREAAGRQEVGRREAEGTA